MNPDDANDGRPEPDHVPDPEAARAASDGTDAGAANRAGPADVQAYIGRQLRAVYEDVVNQPIPDRFLALMKQLEDQTPGG